METILDREKIQKQIDALSKKYYGKKIVIYGAGDYFLFVRDNVNLSSLNITGISDKKFEVSKEENPSSYTALTPDELKNFDFDIILVLLKNDKKLCDYIEYELLMNTKNEDKKVLSLLDTKFKTDAKQHYIKGKRLYEFIYGITSDEDKDKLNGKLSKVLQELKQVKICSFFPANEKKYKQAYKCYKKMTDLLLENIDITKIKPTQEKKYRKFQLDTVEFCKRMTDFLDKNGIEYFISSGTLIGAIRHKGFVPWDDDFDTGVLRKDFEKLKTILKENFEEIDNSEVSISKNNRLEIIDKALRKSRGKILYFHGIEYLQLYQGKNINDCVSMDIFSHDYYRDDYTWEEHREYLKYIRAKRIELDKFPEIIKFLDSEIRSNPNIVEKSNKIYYGIDNLGGYIVTPTAFMREDTIYPRKKMVFEGYEFYAPNSPEGYTEVQYKDFMSFPKNIPLGHDGFKR